MKTAICGPGLLHVTNQTQVLTSPNYPLPYKNNIICTWTLLHNIELNNKLMMLHFTDLDFEDTNDCLSDYLEIDDEQVYEIR